MLSLGPGLEQLYRESPSSINRLRLDLSIDLHPIQPDIPHQRPLQTIGSASRNATRRTCQTLRKDRKEHR